MGFASIVHKFFDKKSSVTNTLGGAVENEIMV